MLRRFLAVVAVIWLMMGSASEAWAARFSPRLSPGDLQIYREAFARSDRGEWRTALEIVHRAQDPLLGEVLRWAYMLSGTGNFPLAQVRPYLGAQSFWPRQEELRKRVEQGLSGDPQGVIRWYTQQPPLSYKGLLGYLTALEDQERTAVTLRSAARKAWVERDFSRTQEREFLSRFSSHLGLEDERRRFAIQMGRAHYQGARRSARRLGAGWELLAAACIALARDSAGVDGLIARVPSTLHDHPQLIYARAQWRYRRKRYDDAAQLIANVTEKERLWDSLRLSLARHYLNEGNFAQAHHFARAISAQDRYMHSEGLWLAGFTALRYLHRPREALGYFETLHKDSRTPVTRARAALWSGMAYDALKMHDRAYLWYDQAGRHPTTFYGQMALRRLGKDLNEALGIPFPLARDAARQESEDTRARLISQLGEIKRPKLQKLFLEQMIKKARDESDWRLLTELTRSTLGMPAALRVARRARSAGVVLLDHLFPRVPLAETLADKALLLAMMRQESSFDHLAVSGSGAQGLMQLMPATARAVARRLRLPYSYKRLREDPKYNLRLGQGYMQQLMVRFDRRLEVVLAGYNAGPTRAKNWLRRFGDPEKDWLRMIDWIERIPIEETRDYVQRVVEAARVYSALLARDRPRSVRG